MTALPKPLPVPTAEELARAQDEAGVEFANGHVVEKPVSIESSEIELAIGALLRSEATKAGSARVFGSSLGYKCFRDDPTKFRKPDVTVVRSERLAGFDPKLGMMPLPPDLAVEVLSPSDLAYDVDAKIQEYLDNGFPLIWVVQPNTRTVTVYRGDGSIALLHDRDEITGESALPTFRCRVADFFAASR
jgi:Uma2 family endonuclease